MKKQQGLTLIELMISLALGLFIISATLTVYVNTIRTSADTIKSARLNHDLDIAMSLMSNDIKRAGYSGGAVIGGGAALLNNPFMAAGAAVSIGTYLTANDCILYTYDANGNAILDANEYYGFRRYLAPNGSNTIQIRSSNVPCNNATAAWQSITDENMVTITALQFSFTSLDFADGSSPCTTATATTCLTAQSSCINASTSAAPTFATAPATTCTYVAGNKFAVKRVVNIRLAGQLVDAGNAEVAKVLGNTVKIRSNRVFTCTTLPCD